MTTEYAAGFFDGEGSIYISSGRALKSGPQYFLCVSVNNVHRSVLDEFQHKFGGTISFTGATATKRGVWRLRLYSKVAAGFLGTLAPHLILKAKQAAIAIDFQNGITANTLSSADKLTLKERISALNQKGPRKR